MELPGYEASSYGDGLADVYDDWFADSLDTAGAVDRLVPLAQAAGGPRARVLELGVGTGRLALPLAAAGLRVTGVDASAAMLARLRAKPGADRVRAVEADMADLAGLDDLLEASGDGSSDDRSSADGRFDLVVIAWNSFFNLGSAAAQHRCLAGVAARLAPGTGRFVIEAFVPADVGDERRTAVEVRSLTADAVVLSVSRHDPEAQQLAGQYVELTEAGGVRLRPWHLRYLTPDQLDGSAAGAGLGLVERWGSWAGEPFDADGSVGHVSVYAAADPEGADATGSGR